MPGPLTKKKLLSLKALGPMQQHHYWPSPVLPLHHKMGCFFLSSDFIPNQQQSLLLVPCAIIFCRFSHIESQSNTFHLSYSCIHKNAFSPLPEHLCHTTVCAGAAKVPFLRSPRTCWRQRHRKNTTNQQTVYYWIGR